MPVPGTQESTGPATMASGVLLSWGRQLGASITREGPSRGSFKRPWRHSHLTACWTHVKILIIPRKPRLRRSYRPPDSHRRAPGCTQTKQGLLLTPTSLCCTQRPPRPGREERTGVSPTPMRGSWGSRSSKEGGSGREGREEAGVCGILYPCPPQSSIPHPSGPLTPPPHSHLASMCLACT